MHTRLLLTAAAATALTAAIAVPAAAHRQWMLPSATVLSGEEDWVTVDAAISNDLFYFEHQPLRAEPVATAPDGTTVAIENRTIGRYRATFDVRLQQKGTYKIAVVMNGVMGSYKLGGKEGRLPRGTTAATLAQAIPAGATDVRTTESSNRNEIFVTSGAPTSTVFKPTGRGIELVPVTHPNDLVSGEAATFQFLLDGKPTAGLPVTVVAGGIRYANKLQEMNLKTDAAGKVTMTWPAPGMYWLNVTSGGGGEGMGAAPAGPPPARRAAYVTTLEVLAP